MGTRGRHRWRLVVSFVLIALVIALFVLVRAVLLAREVLPVLGQHAPRGIEPKDMIEALEAVSGVVEVHDLHVWTLTSGMDVTTAHLVASDGSSRVLAEAGEVLRTRFDLAHATLQVEHESAAPCQGTTW